MSLDNLTTQVVFLQTAQTATNTGDAYALNLGSNAIGFAAYVAGTGAVSATVILDNSWDGVKWILARNTFTLSGTTNDGAEWETVSKMPYWRARVTAISGTGAAVDVVAVGTTKQ